MPEGLRSTSDVPPDDTEATEADLAAVLGGTIIPRKIPVNVFLPSENSVTSFERNSALTDVHTHRPKIVMMAPERPPITGSVGIIVTYDEVKPRGGERPSKRGDGGRSETRHAGRGLPAWGCFRITWSCMGSFPLSLMTASGNEIHASMYSGNLIGTSSFDPVSQINFV